MSDENHDPYDKTCEKIENVYDFEVNRFYQGVTQYYGKIAQEANKTIINWIFALNTGGLILLIPLIFKFYNYQLVISILATVSYFSGVVLIFLSIVEERNKFNKLAEDSENKYKKYEKNFITGREYIKTIQNTPIDKKALRFENASILFWSIGATFSVILLVLKKF